MTEEKIDLLACRMSIRRMWKWVAAHDEHFSAAEIVTIFNRAFYPSSVVMILHRMRRGSPLTDHDKSLVSIGTGQ